MNKKWRISIIIPIYNSEKYLSICLESILQQSYTNYEVLMINDGSTDSSEEICRRFCEDKRFVLINQENRGVSEARNVGIKKSKGDFIAFIDSDDYIKENYLKDLVECVNESVSCVVGGIVYFNEFKLRPKNQYIEQFPITNVSSNENVYLQYLLELQKRIPEPVFGAPYGKLFKRELVIKNDLEFEVGESLAEDLVFNLRFLKYVSEMKICDSANYVYRMFVAGSLSRLVHDFKYTQNRWNVVRQEYRMLKLNGEPMGETRLNGVIENNIVLSVLKENINIGKKYLICKEEIGVSKKGFLIMYLGYYVKVVSRILYRLIQLIVWHIRGGMQ